MVKDAPKLRLKSDVAGLCRAMKNDRLVLRRARENVRVMAQQLVGRWWSENGTEEPVLINNLARYQTVVGRALIGKDPRYLLSSFDRALAPTLSKLQAHANRRAEEMGLGGTIRASVVNSLYSIGITQVSLASPADAAAAGYGVIAGEPFASVVDPDDFVCDTHSTDLRKLGYAGKRVRLPLDVVKKMYGKRARDLAMSSHAQFNADGDSRIGTLFRGTYSTQEEYRQFVDLWEVWVTGDDPDDASIVVLADSQITGAYWNKYRDGVEPLWEYKWIGPPCGPYHYLAMMKVPGNLWPKAPIQDIFDLHIAVNGLANKLVYQADAEKVVYGVKNAATEDAERYRTTQDRGMVPIDEPPVPIATPGPDQGVFNLEQWLGAELNKNAGNLDILSGAAPESDTLGQDRMLNANASRVIGGMQDEVMAHATDVGKAMIWYYNYHPTAVYESVYDKHKGVRLKRRLGPEERHKLVYDTYKIKVDPFSLRYRSPEERLASMDRRVMQQVVPMAPVWAQTGGPSFDWAGYQQMVAELEDEPRWAKLFSLPQPAASGGDGSEGPSGLSHRATKPAETTREVVRRGGGGPSQPAQLPFGKGAGGGGPPGPQPLSAIR